MRLKVGCFTDVSQIAKLKIFIFENLFDLELYLSEWFYLLRSKIREEDKIVNIRKLKPLKEYLKVVSATFLLVCFVCPKESSCETRKNVFHFTSKVLFVLETIKF